MPICTRPSPASRSKPGDTQPVGTSHRYNKKLGPPTLSCQLHRGSGSGRFMSDSALHVCHVIASFPPIVGGAERATETLARAMAARGIDIAVLTRRVPGTAAVFSYGGVQVYRAGLPLRGKLGMLTYGVHGLWLLATRLREFRILHVQSPYTPLLLAVLARLLLRRRLVATLHSMIDISVLRDSALGSLRLRAFRRWVDRFTAISPALLDELHSLGIEQHLIESIPNPVDTTSIAPATPDDRLRSQHSLGLDGSDSSVIVLFVGRLVPLKQVDQLLEAFRMAARETNLRLVVVGDGPQASQLREQTERSGLGAQVMFTGMLKDVRAALGAADIFVLPSRQEGLSVALLEAQAAGLACIVSDLPGNRTLVIDEESGIVFPVGDVPALAQALSRLGSDPDLRARLGSNARRSLGTEYAVDRVVERHFNVYRNLGRKGPG